MYRNAIFHSSGKSQKKSQSNLSIKVACSNQKASCRQAWATLMQLTAQPKRLNSTIIVKNKPDSHNQNE